MKVAAPSTRWSSCWGCCYDAPGGGWEYAAFWATMTAALALLGDGPFALWRSVSLEASGADGSRRGRGDDGRSLEAT